MRPTTSSSDSPRRASKKGRRPGAPSGIEKKTKKLRWKKGSACLSNPAVSAHRTAAKTGFTAVQSQVAASQAVSEKPLSRAALMALQERLASADDDDTAGETSVQIGTFFAGYPAVFTEIVRRQESSVAAHREEAAVLAVIQEIIRAQSIEETEVSYFAALMTAFEQHVTSHAKSIAASAANGNDDNDDDDDAFEDVMDADDGDDDDDDMEQTPGEEDIDANSVAAVSKLLSLVLPYVEEAVMARLDDVVRSFGAALAVFGDTHPAVVRGVLRCVGALLSPLPSPLWTRHGVPQLFQAVLAYTIDTRAKVRHQAHDTVVEIVRRSSFDGPPAASLASPLLPTASPAAAETARFCVPRLRIIVSEQPTTTATGATKKKSQKERKREEVARAAGQLETTANATDHTAGLPAEMVTTLHVLALLKRVIALLPADAIKSCCEGLLRLLGSGQVISVHHSLATFEHLLTVQHTRSRLKAATAAQLFMALLEYQPAAGDVEPSVVWMNIQAHACMFLMPTERQLGFDCVARLVERLVPLFVADQRQTVACAVATLQTVFEQSVAPIVSETAARVTAEATERSKKQTNTKKKSQSQSAWMDEALTSIVEALTSGLGYRFQRAWPTVLVAATALIRSLGRLAYPVTGSLVRAAAQIYDPSERPECTAAVRALVGAATVSYGARVLLQPDVLPLDTFGDDIADPALEFPHSWLLPVLRTHLRNTSLCHFYEDIMPRAVYASQIAEHWRQQKPLIATTYRQLSEQLWALLPGYCTESPDGSYILDKLAPRLGGMLTSEPTLRATLCSAIQQLLLTADPVNVRVALQQQKKQENERDDEEEDDDEEDDNENEPNATKGEVSSSVVERVDDEERAHVRAQMGVHYAKNFLPLLFNVFTVSRSASERNMLLTTIRAYMCVADREYVSNLFRTVIKKLLMATEEQAKQRKQQEGEEDEGGDAAMGDAASSVSAKKRKARAKHMKGFEGMGDQHTMMDLAMAMLPQLNKGAVSLFVRVLEPFVQATDDASLQKKSYAALTMLLESQDPFHRDFCVAHLSTMEQMLSESLVSVSSGAKRNRLRAILSVVTLLPRSDVEFIPTMLTEVMLGTKEVSGKTRRLAFDTLIVMGDRMELYEQEKEAEGEGNEVQMAEGEEETSDMSGVSEFFRMVVAGLAGQTPHMISAAVRSLARLLFHFRSKIDQSMVQQVLETVLMLLESRSREIVDAVFGFVKVALKAVETGVLEANLEGILSGIAFWSAEARNRFHRKSKTLIERCVRRLGVERVDRAFPTEHRRLWEHIVKTSEQKERRKAAEAAGERVKQKGAKGKESSRSFESEMFGSDDEDDDENGDGGERDNYETMEFDEDGGERFYKGEKAKKRLGAAWIREGGGMGVEGEEDEPLDLLGSEAVRHVLSQRPKKKGGSGESGDGFKRAPDGRMIVQEEEEEEDEETRLERELKGALQRGKKRGRSDDGDDGKEEEEDDEEDASVVRKRVKWSEKRKVASSGKPERDGTDYRSKKAGGDVKRKGMPDPYAYVPLTLSSLNRRKGKKGDKMGNLVKSARKGAQKGKSERKRK